MTHRSRSELVRAALAGSGPEIEQLRALCTIPASAKEVSQLLLAVLPDHADAVEEWCHAIVEMHPDMTAAIGRELILKLPPPTGN